MAKSLTCTEAKIQLNRNIRFPPKISSFMAFWDEESSKKFHTNALDLVNPFPSFHIPSFSSPNVSDVGCPLVSLNLKQSIPAITPMAPITVNGNTSCTAIRYWATQGADAAPRRLTTTINPMPCVLKMKFVNKNLFFFLITTRTQFWLLTIFNDIFLCMG